MNRFLWTDDRVAVLRELYPNTRTTAIAQRLGASVASVHTKASKLGLKKTREYMSAEHGAHARLVGVATRIKPGAVSWNKGLHYMPAGNGATRFKPGQRPHNTAQVGALRVNADGYLDVKVGDFPDAPWKNWERVHRLVWIEAHGPIPSGFVVAFKPGRKTVVRDETTDDDDVDDIPLLLWWNGNNWIFPGGSRLVYPRQFMGLAFNPENVLSTNGWMVLGCAMTQGTGGGQRREAA